MLIDTHAHIHFEEFETDLDEIFANAKKNKISTIISVGVDEQDSKNALEFIYNDGIQNLAKGIELFATAGLHPHEAKHGPDALLTIKELVMDGGYGDKLVAIGECGLDYYRNESSKTDQTDALVFQIELALSQGLPLVFHVRDAWEDFFAIIKNFPDLRGVIHSFTGDPKEVEIASNYNLYFGLNGIITFTKDDRQLEAVKLITADKLLIETDCPFLAPVPERGHRNQPAFVKYTAEFLAKLRGEDLEDLATQTTINAQTLFGL